MAIYHFHVKTHSRNKAANAVRCASYRAGERIRDETTGRIYNYRRKSEVAFCEILGPAVAPEWIADRSRLWHEVENSEKYKNARLFREIEGALPKELSLKEQIALVRDFVANWIVPKGMVADFSIHLKPENPHVHISIPDREISSMGFTKKNREWNGRSVVLDWRKNWADTVNRHLANAGFGQETFIDHRTLKEQGFDRLPMVHIGRAHPASKETFEQKRAHNDYVLALNVDRAVESLTGEIEKLKVEIAATEAELEDAETGTQLLTEWHRTRATIDDSAPTQHNPPLLLAPPDDDKGEYSWRAAFIRALGKPEYTRKKFDADCTRMQAELGGPRLRWWLFSYREAIKRYPNSAQEAICAIPPDIRLWISRCLTTMGEELTLSQFTDEYQSNSARSTVPWPFDKTVGTARYARNPGRLSRAVPSVATPHSGNVGLEYRHERLVGVSHKRSALVTQGEIALYALDPYDRVAEMGLKTLMPNAEILFYERRKVCALLGWTYTWKRFYQDVQRLHDPKHYHCEMLDWWKDFFQNAESRGALAASSTRNALYNATPLRYRRELDERVANAAEKSPPSEEKLPDDDITTVSAFEYARDAERSCTGPLVESEYPKAELPIWTIPTLEPPD